MSIEHPIRSDERGEYTTRLGKLRISAELLRSMLHLPDNVKFRNFRVADVCGEAGCDLEMIIESDDMPATPSGHCVKTVVAQYKTERIGDTEHRVAYFDCWRW